MLYKFPLKQNEKIPKVKNYEKLESYPALTELCISGENYGIPCGLNNVIGFDWDLYKSESTRIMTIEDLQFMHGKDTLIVKTPRGGFHVYHTYDDKKFKHWKGTTGLFGGLLDIRIHNNFLVGFGSKINNVEYLTVQGDWNTVSPFTNNDLYEYINTNHFTKNEKVKENYANKCVYNNIQVNLILEIIDKKYIDNYHIWRDIGAALYNCNYDIDSFHTFSKLGSNYSESGVIRQWNSFDRCPQKDIGFGTICHYAKLSNKLKWNLYKLSLITLNQKSQITNFLKNGCYCTNDVISCLFYEKFKNKYVYSNNIWYRLSAGGIYQTLAKDSSTIIGKEIKVYIQHLISSILIAEEDVDKRKGLWKANMAMETNSFLKSCIEISQHNFINENIDFNHNLKLIGFLNGVYDLASHEFRKGCVADRINITTGYNYSDSIDPDNQSFIENLIDSYFVNPETAHWFKKHLGSFLEGENADECFYFWTGKGRNGKGTCDLLLQLALGDYFQIIKSDYFTNSSKNPSQAEPELVILQHARATMTTEPEAEHKYHTGKFKKLVGNDFLQCRALYDKPIKFRPYFKPIIQTNHLPQFTDVDDGLLARLRVIPFEFQFLSENDIDLTCPLHKKVDPFLKQKLSKMNLDFFHFLLKYYKISKEETETKTLPIDIQKSIDSYKNNIDTIRGFFKIALIKTNNEKDRISTVELLQQHNQWSSSIMASNKFSLKLKNNYNMDIKKRTINKDQVMCICGYKWNENYEKITKTYESEF